MAVSVRKEESFFMATNRMNFLRRGHKTSSNHLILEKTAMANYPAPPRKQIRYTMIEEVCCVILTSKPPMASVANSNPMPGHRLLHR